MKLFSFLLPFILACGPALREQQSLVLRVKAAATSCKAKHDRCVSADACAKRAQAAEKAIQLAQEARSKGGATPEQEADAAGSYTAADAVCKLGGW